MFVRVVKAAVLAAVLMGVSSAAGAATLFNFSFSVPWSFVTGGGTATGSGQLFANDLGNGSYEVYGAAGTAKLTSGSATAVLDSTSVVLGLGTPTISLSNGGYVVNAISISGPTTNYSFTKNVFDSNYAVSNGLKTTLLGSPGTLSLSLVPPSAPVPEAATWMMMILGFGAIGAMLRMSKRRTFYHA
jgi:hypothetical protein